MPLKGMAESSLLSKDQPLTPNIDKVIGAWIFKRRAQNTNWQILDFSILVLIFFSQKREGGIRSREFYLRVCKQAVALKNVSTNPFSTNV